MDFTKVPNYFFEHMADMEKCEMAVVLLVIRKTIGYLKDWDEISLSQFMKETGMNKPSVHKGIQSALDRGIITRRNVKNSFEYRTLRPENGSKNEPIESDLVSQNGSENEPIFGSKSEPIFDNGSENEPKSVQKMNTQKNIDIYNNTLVLLRTANADAPANSKRVGKKASKQKRATDSGDCPESPEQQQWFGAVCWLVHGHQDYKLLAKVDKLAIGQTVKAIRDSNAGYTIDDLRSWYTTVWSQEWPGKQKGGNVQRPTHKQIKTGIGRVKALNGPPPPTLNGNGHSSMSVFSRDFQGSEA